MSSLTTSETAWIEKLSSPQYDQAHVVKDKSPEVLKAVVQQIEGIEKSYPGGLLAYIERAREFLKNAKADVNPFGNCKPTVPHGESLETGSEAFAKFEQIGLKALSKIGFVLVAGGLGERLGYPDIKIGLPIETTTNMTYIEFYCRMIQACENYAKSKLNSQSKIPFAIMTSGDTHEKTVNLLKKNNYFNLEESQVTIMQQQKVPTLVDSEAHLGVQADGLLETKPHGHGDVHTLLNQYGLTEKWVKNYNTEYIFFMQDTNGLALHALVPMLGVSIHNNFAMNSLGVPRKPGEAVGAICKLEQPDKPSLTINVEYNQLSPLLASTGLGGDLADPKTGYSQFPGNTNVLLFHLPPYAAALKKSGGAIPEFVNPKYKDASKTAFKSSTRLECLMQEFPRLFDSNCKVGMTQLDRWLCFSTVKNNLTDAIAKSKAGTAAESPFTGESDQYQANAKLLELAAKAKGIEVSIAKCEPANFLGVEYQMGPRVVICPSFALSLEQIKEQLISGPLSVALNSTLILEGSVNIQGLSVDGALHLKGSNKQPLTVENLKVSNKGWEMKKLQSVDEDKENLPLPIRIRGYKIERHEATKLSC